MADEWIDVSIAARLYGCSVGTMYRMINNQVVKARPFGAGTKRRGVKVLRSSVIAAKNEEWQEEVNPPAA